MTKNFEKKTIPSLNSTFIDQASGARSAPGAPMPVSIIGRVQYELVRDFARSREHSAKKEKLYGLFG
jgi:hypothetical protein